MTDSSKPIQIFVIVTILAGLILNGCARTRIGKVDLSSGNPPEFMKIGETTLDEVLDKIGEPLGYREKDNRSAMIYINFHENYIYFIGGDFRYEKSFRLDLVFQDKVLIKAEVKREGWGFGGNVDPQLLQLLVQ